jgi:transposase
MRTRRKFSDEFKREAVKVASQPGVTFTMVARELGVERSVLRRWVENARTGRYDTAIGKPLKSDAQAELEQVKRELARVKMERDVLKKALGYFAKDPT